MTYSLNDILELALLPVSEQCRIWRRCRNRHGKAVDLVRAVGWCVIFVMFTVLKWFFSDVDIDFSKHWRIWLVDGPILWLLLLTINWFERRWFNWAVHQMRPYIARYIPHLKDLNLSNSFPSGVDLLKSDHLAHWRTVLLHVGAGISDNETTLTSPDAARQTEAYATLCDYVCGNENTLVIRALLDSMQTGEDYGAYQPAIDAMKRFPPAMLAQQLINSLPDFFARALIFPRKSGRSVL